MIPIQGNVIRAYCAISYTLLHLRKMTIWQKTCPKRIYFPDDLLRPRHCATMHHDADETSRSLIKLLSYLLFQAEEGRAQPAKAVNGQQQKWVSSYVPYGEYPAGKATVAIEDDGAQESTSNGVDAKWKKNYVPFDEEKREAKE